MIRQNSKLLDAEKKLKAAKFDQEIDLSQEKLSLCLDYSFLASLIQKSPLIKKIILPKFKKTEAELALGILNEATVNQNSLEEIRMDLSEFRDNLPYQIKIHLEQIYSRLQRNKKRIFGIHGGGNIGLGLMAEVIGQSSLNYHILATSSDKFLTTLINSANKLWINYSNTARDSELKLTSSCIKNIKILNSNNSENILHLYQQSCLMALCLTEEGFLNVASLIARGLIERYAADGSGVKILILMNKPNCQIFVKNILAEEIFRLTNNNFYTQKILAVNQFIPTVVDRIVSKVNSKQVLTQLKNQLVDLSLKTSSVEILRYKVSPHKKNLEQHIDEILTHPAQLAKIIAAFDLRFHLFNVEKNFALYVPQSFVEFQHFPAMKMVNNIERFMAVKNKFINGPHAILAWMGGLIGYQTVSEAIQNQNLLSFIKNLMTQEIVPILKTEFPEITLEELKMLKTSFLKRCLNNSEDLIIRVGRDPLRKLNRGGCVRGLFDLKQKHGIDLPTSKLEQGWAAGILYAIKGIDPTNKECQKILELYKQDQSYKSILCFKEKYGRTNYPGLDPNKDKVLLNNILNQIDFLARISPNLLPSRINPILSMYATTYPITKERLPRYRFKTNSKKPITKFETLKEELNSQQCLMNNQRMKFISKNTKYFACRLKDIGFSWVKNRKKIIVVKAIKH